MESQVFVRGEVACDLFSVLSGGDESPAVETWPPFEKGDGVAVFVEQMDRGFIVVACHDPADEARALLAPRHVGRDIDRLALAHAQSSMGRGQVTELQPARPPRTTVRLAQPARWRRLTAVVARMPLPQKT